jgi:hypothetical protein
MDLSAAEAACQVEVRSGRTSANQQIGNHRCTLFRIHCRVRTARVLSALARARVTPFGACCAIGVRSAFGGVRSAGALSLARAH